MPISDLRTADIEELRRSHRNNIVIGLSNDEEMS